MRGVDGGFALDVPDDEVLRGKLTEVFERHGVVTGTDGFLMLPIPQHVVAGVLVDAIDRVNVGAAFLRDLVRVDG
ncbi:hypothetical protein [Actinoplanes utahensis]|nr:hypothetical protein [Actinoplanes utahensis]GIF28058.1 hypothetical protein Aut01nite_10440 [Actinoplanes utahensis]